MNGASNTGLPRGWFATAAGGVLGTIAGGFLGVAVSSAYADAYQSNEGLEGLGTIIAGTVLMGVVGAVLGAAGALKIFCHDRPVASGLTFAMAAVLIALLLGSVGQLIVPQELHDGIGAIVLFTLSPLLAGITSRLIFARS